MKCGITKLLYWVNLFNMRKLVIIFLVLSLPVLSSGQEKLGLSASDGLEITADFYQADPFQPYMIFMHQAGSSRGEYNEIAPRFLKMGYNCLVVDLRSGGEMNYVQNETAKRAKQENIPHSMLDARRDVAAAVDYAFKASGKPVILFGSSYSATLALEEAKSDPKVQAVIAFSPGEYFPGHSVKETLAGFKKPYFVTGSLDEKPYIEELLSETNSSSGIIFSPQDGQGRHGASTLWKEEPSSSEYWLALIMFIRSL